MARFIGLLLAAWAACFAQADSVAPLRVSVTTADGRSAFREFHGTQNSDGIEWNTPGPTGLRDADGWLATIAPVDDEPLFVFSQTSIRFNFELMAGQSDTTFTISGPLVSFPPIENAQAAASATVVLTDSGADGASFNGLLSSGSLGFEYNAAVRYGELIDRIDADPGGSQGCERADAQSRVCAAKHQGDQWPDFLFRGIELA